VTQDAVLLALLAVLALPVLVVRRLPRVERRAVVLVLLAALALRVVAAVTLHASGAWQLTGRGAVTPDEATVDVAARLLALGDERSPVVLGGSLHTSWLLVSWAVYDLLWNSLLAIKLLNALLGTALVVPVYLLARRLHSPAAARLAGWLVALFPAAVVWSALALRESLLALLLTTLVLLAVTAVPLSWRGRLGWIGLGAAALVVLAFTRSYMVPLMVVVLVGAAGLRSFSRRGWWDVTAAVAVVLLALGTVLVLPTGRETARVTVALVAEPVGNVYNPFSDCEDEGSCVAEADPRAAGADSGRLPGAAFNKPATGGTDDLSGSLQSVEQKGPLRAFAIAVLAGRPVWRTAEFFLLLQPAVVIWWTLLPLVGLGSVALVRARRWDALLATAGYAGAVVVFLALTGQFIRHHYMLEPVGLALAAAGITAVRAATPGAVRTAVLVLTAAMAAAATASVIASLP
jgi:4-amino-4-deoxy-L-arabinose transferase-like glycosyltransferase